MDTTIQAAAAKLVRQLKEAATLTVAESCTGITRQHAHRYRWGKCVVSKIMVTYANEAKSRNSMLTPKNSPPRAPSLRKWPS